MVVGINESFYSLFNGAHLTIASAAPPSSSSSESPVQEEELLDPYAMLAATRRSGCTAFA